MNAHNLNATPSDLPVEHREAARQVGIVGQSSSHRQLLATLEKVADTNVEVLIVGPTGVGKELYARYLHECGSRRKGSFVPVNCGALPDGLFENEMFGHQAGAYTGASRHSEGLVAAAEGGTLFLDEVDTLSPWSQVKLLRLLQEREFRRLGETRVRHADVRFVAATNADLRSRVRAGQFREDLFFRLHVVPVHVEPLAERREDIALLTVAFIDRYARQYGLHRLALTEAAWERLITYSWPGNIRELENCVRHLISCQFDRPVEAHDIRLIDGPPGPTPAPARADAPAHAPATDPTAVSLSEGKREVVRRYEVHYLQSVLRRTGGNIAEAARIARKHRRAFFELLRKYDIDATLFRDVPSASGPVPSPRRNGLPTGHRS